MKKVYTVSLFAMTSYMAISQNVQLHYDFGKDRQMLTSTVEMFRRDSFGSSFFFGDFDYGGKKADVDGVSRSYWEISRELKFWEPPLTFHAEYDGGMFRTKTKSAPINSSFLFGCSYAFSSKDFSRALSIQLLYKYIDDANDASFQITAVWGIHLFNRKLSFTGFADFWRQDVTVFDDDGNASNADFVFVSEPQLWYNFHQHLSIGGEVEISSNFSGNKGFMANPTLALKWIF